jgi:hypothetical protein
MSLGLLTDLVTMGKDIKSLVKGDGSGFISKALGSFTKKTDPATGLDVSGRARDALEQWPTPTKAGISVGYQGVQTGKALKGLDYFSRINNANVLLAKDNWNAVFQSINTSNTLPNLGGDSDIDESKAASSPTITLES